MDITCYLLATTNNGNDKILLMLLLPLYLVGITYANVPISECKGFRNR